MRQYAVLYGIYVIYILFIGHTLLKLILNMMLWDHFIRYCISGNQKEEKVDEQLKSKKFNGRVIA